MYGNSFESYLVAVVVPQQRWLREHALSESTSDLAAAARKDEVRPVWWARVGGCDWDRGGNESTADLAAAARKDEVR